MDAETTSPPFGMDPALPAFHRATRLAETLFGGAEASVVLVDGARIWRCGGSLVGTGVPPIGVRRVIERGKAMWADDLGLQPGLLAEAQVEARFWAGSPVRLADGSTIGVLTVRGLAPRAYDKALAARLQDLADSVADECERARVAAVAAERDLELRRTRQVLSAFVQSAPIGSVMTDRDFIILAATPRWLESMGLTEAEALGRRLPEIAAEAFIFFESHFTRCLAGEVVSDARVPTRVAGQLRWMTLELTPWRDESGEIAGVISAAQDITDTVDAIRRLERTQERLQLSTELAKIEVYDIDYRRRAIDRAGKLLFPMNAARERTVREQVLDRDTDRLVDPRDVARVSEAWRRYEAGEADDYEVEYRVPRGPGETIWIAEVAQARRGEDGAIRRVIGAMQDITARKQAEGALIEAK